MNVRRLAAGLLLAVLAVPAALPARAQDYAPGALLVRWKPAARAAARAAALAPLGAARVAAYDPLAQSDEVAYLPRFTLHRKPADAVREASALILMSQWPPDLTLTQAAKLMARPVVVDTGNHLDPATAKAAGLDYSGVGR